MIFLVRHGEAAASWGDHPDPGLSETGRKQAQTVAHTLLERGACRAISSPMTRCRETATPFSQLVAPPVELCPAISEIVTPAGVGDRVAWLRALMSGTWPATMDTWRQSALGAVSDLEDGTVVFSHFVAINAIVGKITGREPVLVFKPDHCSITQVERAPDGTLRLNQLGTGANTKVL